jgi:hypothetical protein
MTDTAERAVLDATDPVNDMLLHIVADMALRFAQRLAADGFSTEQINYALEQVRPHYEAERRRKLDHLHRLLDICPPSRAVH